MSDDLETALLPSKVLFELCNALIFHLFETGKIDPDRIAMLLEDRQKQHEAADPGVALIMQPSIDWLKGLRSGGATMPAPPRLH
ncbi:MAG: hypothetical protein WDN02_17515 [Methylovirgula sp.]|uniref:hypothetical protein n=1 Tax=Methylovirgula sp. TaxID=1978224 RepID=UPI0030766E2C